MTTAMRILVAHDGSDSADAAIDDLALAGLPDHSDAVILSVVDAWLPEASRSGGRADNTLPGLKEIRAAVLRRVEAQRDIAETAATRLRTLFPTWRVRVDACIGSPAAEIIRRAERGNGGFDNTGRPADLTVVGSRGLGPITRFTLGSVAQRVLHGLRGCIRIARVSTAATSSRHSVDGDPWIADDRNATHRSRSPRILIGVDGSAHSDAAVHAVATRDWPTGTHVLVACYAQGIDGLEHSNATSLAGLAATGTWSGDVVAERAAPPVESWATRTAARAASTLRECCPGLSVSSVVRVADPSYALAEEAANWGDDARHPESTGADCIFVGASGVRGIERFLLGSVSASVAMNAHCSVEVVQPRPSRATTTT